MRQAAADAPTRPAAAEASSPTAAGAVARRSQRRRRCGECAGCLGEDCGLCRYCRDRPAFGGKGTLRHTCERRRCTNLQPDLLSPRRRSSADGDGGIAAGTRSRGRARMGETNEVVEAVIVELDADEEEEQEQEESELPTPRELEAAAQPSRTPLSKRPRLSACAGHEAGDGGDGQRQEGLLPAAAGAQPRDPGRN
jgi:hypothetical protein